MPLQLYLFTLLPGLAQNSYFHALQLYLLTLLPSHAHNSYKFHVFAIIPIDITP